MQTRNTNSGRRPRVLLLQDILFSQVPLSSIVEEAGCELALPPDDVPIWDALDRVRPPLDLIVTSLSSRASSTLEWVAEFRKRGWLATTPILVVGCLDGAGLDLWQLRSLGIAGLIDRDALPEHVRFRIAQVAYKGREGRLFERAPCCIPVEVAVGGERITAFATSLSVGGMGLACPERIEPNTAVTLRFALDEGKPTISARGRTVHLREVHREDARYHVGIFFLDLGDRLQIEIGMTVARLLAAWDVIEDTNLKGGESTDLS